MRSTSVGQVVPVHKPEIDFVGQRRGVEGLATFSRAILSAACGVAALLQRIEDAGEVIHDRPAYRPG